MTILVGYVPTPEGEAALAAAIAEAAVRGSDLVVLNSPRRGATVDTHLVDEQSAEQLVARAAERGVTARVDQAERGADIVDVFEALVRQTSAELVVIGLRRRSPVGKLVMGSDAQRLLLALDVPVLTAKPTR